MTERIDSWFEHSEEMMGTFVSVALRIADDASASRLGSQCFDLMHTISEEISGWSDGGVLTRLNRERHIARAECSHHLQTVLELGIRAFEISGGTFSPWVGTLSKRWRHARESGRPPSPGEIRGLIEELSETSLIISPDEIRLSGGAELDLDSIGKGYVIDRGGEFLKGAGVKYARINAGGDLIFMGDTEWRIDLEDPEQPGVSFGHFTQRGNFGVATSGIGHSSWMANGVTYHHLIDPRSGYPGGEHLSFTVIAKDCATANALSLAAFFLPAKSALDFLSSHGAVGIAVDRARGVAHSIPFSYEQ